MFGKPETGVAPFFGMLSEIESVAEGFGDAPAGPDGGEIEDGVAHIRLDAARGLLDAEGDGGIDAGGAKGRNRARRERDRGEENGHGDEGGRIGGFNAVKDTAQAFSRSIWRRRRRERRRAFRRSLAGGGR